MNPNVETRKWEEADVPDQSGRVVVVTGGGNGVASAIESARPTSLRIMNQNLEDIFLAAVGDEAEAPAAVAAPRS